MVSQVADELWLVSRKNPNGHPALVDPVPARLDGPRPKGYAAVPAPRPETKPGWPHEDTLNAQHVGVVLPTGEFLGVTVPIGGPGRR